MVANTEETPSGVMYRCCKQFGHINFNDLAAMVFSDTFNYGGAPMRERLTERTFLSRVVTRALPGDFPERAFRPFPELAEAVCARLLAAHPGIAGKREVIAYLAGPACEDMCMALRAYGANDILYRNIVGRLQQMELSNETDKATLLVLQFIATGCLGDSARAAELTQEYTRRIFSAGFRTALPHEGEAPVGIAEEDADTHLGLCRIIDGKLKMPAHPLSTDEFGTEIGLFATGPCAINDVDQTVSRRHVRIVRDSAGRWYAQGLGSTNGTTVIRGDTKVEEPIELPRDQRSASEASKPVRIYPSDILCLAGTTRFMVLELA